MGRLYYWVANWNLSRARAAQLLAAHGPVVDMVDCTHDALPRVRDCFGVIKHVAGYVTGTPDIAWTGADFANLPHDVAALSIDQSNRDLPLLGTVHVVKDVEPGASTPHEAVVVAGERLRRGEDASIYVDASELGAVEDQVAQAGLPAGQIVGYQWASPSSNPNTPLPGTRWNLASANADLSVVLASWLPAPGHPPPPPPPVGRVLIELHQNGGWDVIPQPGTPIQTGDYVWRSELRQRDGKWELRPLPAEHV